MINIKYKEIKKFIQFKKLFNVKNIKKTKF